MSLVVAAVPSNGVLTRRKDILNQRRHARPTHIVNRQADPASACGHEADGRASAERVRRVLQKSIAPGDESRLFLDIDRRPGARGDPLLHRALDLVPRLIVDRESVLGRELLPQILPGTRRSSPRRTRSPASPSCRSSGAVGLPAGRKVLNRSNQMSIPY